MSKKRRKKTNHNQKAQEKKVQEVKQEVVEEQETVVEEVQEQEIQEQEVETKEPELQIAVNTKQEIEDESAIEKKKKKTKKTTKDYYNSLKKIIAKNPKIWFWGMVVVVFIAIFMWPMKRSAIVLVNDVVNEAKSAEPRAISDHEVSIKFKCPEMNMDRMGLVFCTYDKKISGGTLIFKLKDCETGEYIAKAEEKASIIEDNQELIFYMDRQKNSKNREYELELLVIDTDNPVGVWYNENEDNILTTYVNGEEEGNLCAKVYAYKLMFPYRYYAFVWIGFMLCFAACLPQKYTDEIFQLRRRKKEAK